VKFETFPLKQSIVDDPLPSLAYLTKVLLFHDMNTMLYPKYLSWRNKNGPRQRMNSPEYIIFIYELTIYFPYQAETNRGHSFACDEAKNMPQMLEEEIVLVHLD
jgi:hypothetical protein